MALAPVLAAPLEERGLADAVLAQQVDHCDAALGVFEDGDNLGLAELSTSA